MGTRMNSVTLVRLLNMGKNFKARLKSLRMKLSMQAKAVLRKKMPKRSLSVNTMISLIALMRLAVPHLLSDLYKKRESEVAKIKRDVEESNIQHDAAVAAFRKKHNDAVAEMSEQLDHLAKLKSKI